MMSAAVQALVDMYEEEKAKVKHFESMNFVDFLLYRFLQYVNRIEGITEN